MSASNRPSPRDQGFTLIELILAIAILGILMVALTGMLLAVFKVNGQTERRVDESNDRQFAATYFADDTYGAKSIDPAATAPCVAGQTPLVQFTLPGFTTSVDATGNTVFSADATFVDYFVSGDVLIRAECKAAGVPMSQKALVRNLSATPTVKQHALLNCEGSPAKRGSTEMVIIQTSGESFRLCGTQRVG